MARFLRWKGRYVHWTRERACVKEANMAQRKPNDDTAGRRQTLAAVIVIAVLLLGGWWLMSELQRHRDVQDCISSGRRDCVQVVPDK
jgi:hypothetical protein